MATIYEIPLINQAQKLKVQLGLTTYQLYLRWNFHSQSWVMDLMTSSGVVLVGSIPLVTGVNLISPYPELGIDGELWAQTDGNTNAVPTYSNLGVEGRLYFKVP